MLGCSLRTNTSMHAIEELIEPPYLFGSSIVYTLADENGNRIEKKFLTHNFEGWEQRYDRASDLLRHPDYCVGKVHQAETYLIEARTLKETALNKLQSDQLYFVDKIKHLRGQ